MPQKVQHYKTLMKTMKPIKSIHPDRVTEDTVPGTLHGPNDYQYYRMYDNGWELSIVCNYAVRDFEKGYFEIGVKNIETNFNNGETYVIGTALDFDKTARFLRQFEANPNTALHDWVSNLPEIESGI